jgi:adenine-specific DNA-methyltransferase
MSDSKHENTATHPSPIQEPEHFDLRSQDISAEKQAELVRLFPEVRTEGGKIDFDRLKRVLGETVDPGRERYGMNWPGKADCFKAIQRPSLGTLLPCREESMDFDVTENLIIEGDNLEVLKLLQKSYLGKIKMIYIDPPYNTGNDFIYPDDFADSIKNYLALTGQVDAAGRKFSTNTDTDGRFHSKWINMMYPRLYLARNLLRDDGVVFMSIDDVEIDNLKKLCSEIFGEENFVELIIWRKRSTPPNDKIIGANHDYILIFAKNIESVGLNLRERSEERLQRYRNQDEHPKGPWVSGDLSANVKGGRYVESLSFPIQNPNTNEDHYPPAGGNWRFNREKIANLLANDEIYFGEDGRGRPKLKRFLCDVKDGITYPTIWDFVPLNNAGSQEMAELLGDANVFENPKPSGLIAELMRLGCAPDGIVLDFFAGSGTTAHAAIKLNHEDKGHRRFILVQLPEPTGRQEYKTIAHLTRERVRRVVSSLSAQGQLTLSETIREDDGFRAFRLAESSFAVWNGNGSVNEEEIVHQLELHIEHTLPGRSSEDILFEILLKSGFPLTTKFESLTLSGMTVYSVAEGAMLICLEKELTQEAIKAIADRKPERVVCLDEGFAGNDQLKTNAVQIMKTKGVTSFRTV